MLDFKAPFNQQEFFEFLRIDFLPDDYEIIREEITHEISSKSSIKRVQLMGRVPSLNDLHVYLIEHSSENDPRITITKETCRLMSRSAVRNALAVYISENSQNYRFSYIQIDISLAGTGIKREYSNPKRYSYFLGPDAKVKTPENQLNTKVNDIDDLRERFSIEVVNKDFYNEIALLFTKLVGGKRRIKSQTKEFTPLLKLPSMNNHQIMQEFGVRLLGRIIFCWFLKKKVSNNNIPLISDELLSLNAVNDNTDYYHTVIEHLFFLILNKKHEQRPQVFRQSPYNEIPFLNGGLFEAHVHDYYIYKESLGYSENRFILQVPDEWFKELFQLLELYNFTIDENTTVDVDISVDPEMLGRIFENLLAEINPETGETARKATGSYYTPRPIVDYMVSESLKQYLKNNTSMNKEKIDTLFEYDEDIKYTQEECREVLKSFHKIKVLDPACGSGAFPMGILQRMVNILERVDKENLEWLQMQLETIPDTTLRKAMWDNLCKENWSYIHKLGIIRDCIHGVDIQAIALEISKLRVFLSLIVDSKVIDSESNRNIKPLPNLEFKFVCANTLVGLPEGNMKQTKKEEMKGNVTENGKKEWNEKNILMFGEGEKNQFVMFEDDDNIKKLATIRVDYFNSYGMQKKELENEFKDVQLRMYDKMYAINGNRKQKIGEKTLTLASWKPFSDESTDWFDMEWMFGIKEGFDIVTGNPPYLRIQGLFETTPELVEFYKKYFLSATGRFDLYCLFTEKGIGMLNKNGVLNYIMPFKWTNSSFGKGLRRLVIGNGLINRMISFGAHQVFNASTYSSLLWIKNNQKENFQYIGLNKDLENNDSLQKWLNSLDWTNATKIKMIPNNDDNLTLTSDKNSNVLKKIKLQNDSILNIFSGIYQGVVTGDNKIFWLKNCIKIGANIEGFSEALNERILIENDLAKPLLNGNTINRYENAFDNTYLIYPYYVESGKTKIYLDKQLESKFPLTFKYFKSLEERLRNRGSKKMNYPHWYALWNHRSILNQASKGKILTPDVCHGCQMWCDMTGDYYYTDTSYSLVIKNDFSKLIYAYYSILNSNLLWFYLKNTGAVLRGSYFRFKTSYLKDFMLPKITESNSVLLKDLIINSNINLIDLIVYKLYSLTYKEVKIVDSEFDKVLSQFNLTEDDYEKMCVEDLGELG